MQKQTNERMCSQPFKGKKTMESKSTSEKHINAKYIEQNLKENRSKWFITRTNTKAWRQQEMVRQVQAAYQMQLKNL